MRLTTKGRYAVTAMLDLALHGAPWVALAILLPAFGNHGLWAALMVLSSVC